MKQQMKQQMKRQMRNLNTIALICLFSLNALAAKAAGVAKVDVKNQLALSTGDYTVTSVDLTPKDEKLCTGVVYKWSAKEEQRLCETGAVHTVRWSNEGGAPILVVGAARTYSDFNAGLITDPKISVKDTCTYSHNTQTSNGRLIDDTYANCATENSSTHAEIAVKQNVLEYYQVTKISHEGKVICLPLKCTLTKTKP